MKSVLMITALLMSALAFGQEKQAREPEAKGQSAEQSRSYGNAQGENIVDPSKVLANSISLVLANRTGLPFDWTKHALKDKEGLCKVHHDELTGAVVPMPYGLAPSPPYSKETEERLFPNALTSVEAGCIALPVKEAIVLQCQTCIEAKTKWVESNKPQCDCGGCLLNRVNRDWDCPNIRSLTLRRLQQ
jgi:hypothetical protein